MHWISLHGWDMPTRGLSEEPGHSQQASDADNLAECGRLTVECVVFMNTLT